MELNELQAEMYRLTEPDRSISWIYLLSHTISSHFRDLISIVHDYTCL